VQGPTPDSSSQQYIAKSFFGEAIAPRYQSTGRRAKANLFILCPVFGRKPRRAAIICA
jgi:hypothetical protein